MEADFCKQDLLVLTSFFLPATKHNIFSCCLEVDVVVERDGKELTLKQTLLPTRFLVARGLYDQQPPFFIIGGLVLLAARKMYVQ